MSDIVNVTVNQPSPSIIQLNVPGQQGKQGSAGIVAAGPQLIQALGDSISARSIYQPANLSTTNIPAWAPSTIYAIGAWVLNGGNLYYTQNGGTSASSGGPAGTANGVADNTISWNYGCPLVRKFDDHFLKWACAFSGGQLIWDMTTGYSGFAQGISKAIVVSGGSGYTSPTITFNNGATGTVQMLGGVITGVTILTPGFAASGFTYTLSDPTGTGASLSLVAQTGGTFGVPGCTTADMVARLSDCVASAVKILTVFGGTNDLSQGFTYTTITTNLRTCYETLVSAGKKVIAIPITPRVTTLTAAQQILLQRVNRWIRAYGNGDSWANPLGISIAVADPTGYLMDGTNSLNQSYGSTGTVQGTMTVDGLHPSPRGAMYIGWAVWQAAQQITGPAPSYIRRSGYGMLDGFDPVLNPGGNLLEGYPWQASNPYAYGQFCSNGGNVYRCKVSGTSASSGGPTGTGSTITDGGAQWAYVRPSGLSVLASGTAGTNTATTGITFSGSLATGLQLVRSTGSASGTISEAIESPWSSGQPGQRQSITFTLGGGTTTELWQLYINNSVFAGSGIPTSEINNGLWYCESEIEISGVALLNQLSLTGPSDSTANTYYTADGYTAVSGLPGSYMSSSNEMIAIPNSGKFLLKTQAILLPSNGTNLAALLGIGFNASGAAGTATLTLKINSLAIRKVGVA